MDYVQIVQSLRAGPCAGDPVFDAAADVLESANSDIHFLLDQLATIEHVQNEARIEEIAKKYRHVYWWQKPFKSKKRT